MRNGSTLTRVGVAFTFLLLMAMALPATGCFGTRGFPSPGSMRVRIINESLDPVSDITVTHGTESIYQGELSPGRRSRAQIMRIQEDEDIIISYFHPRVGSEREVFGFRSREADPGYLEIRFDRYGVLDVRSRFRLTETR